MRSFEELLTSVQNRTKNKGMKKVVLCGAEDREGLISVREALHKGIAAPVCVGQRSLIEPILEELGLTSIEVVATNSEEETAFQSVQCVRQGNGDFILKGGVKTSVLLKAVLHKETGIRKEPLLSHTLVTEMTHQKRFLLITDGGMVIKPTLEEKVAIIANAVKVAKSLGIFLPKIACICAVEVVNPSMPESVDSAILSKMNQRGQIKDCLIEGPVGIDIALDAYAAKVKKIGSEVGGKADILLVPDIHSGNFLGKSAEYFGHFPIGGMVVGAKVPILIVSRADKAESKLNSILLGANECLGGNDV
ncbi:MAG TPA: phosphate acyltransferase [Thermotogota bacterium]|nr:phosphate acyltransferase [Thermotogota bacterium]HQQ65176.1 phosphate acyltransferase [Thermotogota bacterium]